MQGARLCEPARGSPSPPTPANLSPTGNWGGNPWCPSPRSALGQPDAFPAGPGEGRGCGLHVRPGERDCFMCKGPRRGKARDSSGSQLTPKFNFSTYTHSSRWVSVLH